MLATLTAGLGSPRRASRLVERNLTVYRHSWVILVSGFFEPLVYLLGIGYGVGSLVGTVSGGTSYRVFVAPALMTSSAVYGVIYEVTFNVFFKMRYAKVYDAVLATPMGIADIAAGEVAWALLRGTLYSIGFVVVMAALGLVASPWAVLAVPGALLVAFCFGTVGIAATTWVRSWHDFDAIQVVLLPLFLFSATFYPLDVYPRALQGVVQLSPLYHGVHLIRGLTTGAVGAGQLLDVAFLAGMGLAGLAVASRRLRLLLLV
jgi:lipooligosaccharide transport system permease protein